MAYQNPTSAGSLDIGRAFQFMFEDPEWIKKILIGGIVSLIPIVNFATLGYMLEVIKNVADGNPRPLPDWNNFGTLFMKGLYAFVGVLVLSLPLILVWCCIIAVSTALGGSSGSSSDSSTSGIIGVVISCLSCLMVLYGIALAVYSYAALTRFALSGQLSTFWDFRGTLALIQSNLSGYLIALVMTIVASFIAGFGTILCFVGVLFTTFWAQLFSGHLFGQFARISGAAGMAPAPMPPMAPPPMTPPPAEPGQY